MKAFLLGTVGSLARNLLFCRKFPSKLLLGVRPTGCMILPSEFMEMSRVLYFLSLLGTLGLAWDNRLPSPVPRAAAVRGEHPGADTGLRV